MSDAAGFDQSIVTPDERTMGRWPKFCNLLAGSLLHWLFSSSSATPGLSHSMPYRLCCYRCCTSYW